MPTVTFANLPAEKRQAILNAARAEFSRVPIEEASINRIIKDAKISRGSFYMYFTDKSDLVNELFQEMKHQFSQLVIESFTRFPCDLSQAMLDIHDRIHQHILIDDQREFIRNFLSQFMPFRHRHSCETNAKQPMEIMLQSLLPLIDRLQFHDQSDRFIECTLELGFSLLFGVMFDTLIHRTQFETAHAHYQSILTILKHGYHRKEGTSCLD